MSPKIRWIALWIITALQQKQRGGATVPADMELEISVFLAVTDGGAMEMLMVPCTKALL